MDLFIKRELASGVIEVKLNREKIHNAFNEELILQLISTFKELNQSEKLRLVVLTGAGKSFCAGADLNWMSSMVQYTEQENQEDSEKLYELFSIIDSCPVPVVGKINGHALGGGVGLVSVCDYAISHDKAKFGFTEVRLGLIPAVISSFCINKIGFSHARAWFLSGEKFSAKKALEIGLIHEVSEVEKFDERVEEVIESFLQASPLAAREAKNLLKNLDKGVSSVKDYTCSQIAKVRVSEYGQEGMKALLEKRQPNWIIK